MSIQDLRQSLDGFRALRDELAAGERAAGDEWVEKVDHLIDDLEHQIDHLHDEEKKGSLIDRLRHVAEQFEVEHPQLTETSNRISVLLSGMGI